jgi:hypothetical protein
MPRIALAPLVAAAALALGACGARHSTSGQTVRVESFGRGAGRVWVFEPPGKATSAVVFLHGAGWHELRPRNHWRWLQHLARDGSVVLYPKYETVPGTGGVDALVSGLRAATAHVDVAKLPALAIGYSRGAWLVFPYATAADRTGVRIRAILSIFPSSPEPPFPDLGLIPAGTRIQVLAGESDQVVGKVGAAQVLTLLGYARYPHELTGAAIVHSHGSFVATHLAPLSNSPSARRAFWARADALLARLRSSS